MTTRPQDQSLQGEKPPSVREQSRRGGARPVLALIATATIVGLALMAAMLRMERQAVRDAAASTRELQIAGAHESARITGAAKALKLVTVELDTTVLSRSTGSSWRGGVSASVHAPATLAYGTDLSGLEPGDVSFDQLLRSCLVRVPPPRRIATEVFAEKEKTEVKVGWARFRAMAGEYHLGLARRDLHQEALELTLSPEDAAIVREETRRQVAKLVRTLVSGAVFVRVAFDDELPRADKGLADADVTGTAAGGTR